ncbi:MAG: aspartate 1-decarboxylase [Planctomycetota bacterium]
MLLELLKAKIHRATVTFTDVDYPGSITIDQNLLDAAGMLVNEKVLIADCDNGERFETYIIPGPRGEGTIGVNGAAARLSGIGHKVIILAFVQVTPDEAQTHESKVVLVDEKNQATKVLAHASSSAG